MYFATEPGLLRLERMMTLIPNFPPRFCGVRVYGDEAAPVGTTHVELIRSAMRHVRNPAFRKRLNDYIEERKECAMNYRGMRHRVLFQNELQKRENPSAALLCALYLLTADCRLWSRVRRSVRAKGVQFQGVRLGELSPEAYTLYMTAKDLCCGTKHITVSDLADKEIVSPQMFGILCEAMTIRRYGMAALSLENGKEVRQNG